ncbi:UNVERIFIED_CONTAM: N6-adenosine-methyltransferase MT-A70-like [Sesamum calycinum]|uniref:N6-adenosine-methyltransferase MT-A70-like n=1 Tax=Sesamum calycinum TaxID=2727403 RepID=A0AAW2JDI2_9LAMI
MEGQGLEGNEDSIPAIKEMRRQLESRMDTLHTTQLDLIASLQSLVPDLVSSLDLSLKAISENSKVSSSAALSRPSPRESERALVEENGGPLSVVRSMVAVCLLERVPFNPIDSSTVLRKLENDSSATVAERAALRELGGESGAILAVEMALRSMAEDNGGVDLEEFVVSGKSRVIVMNIDRTRLLKELPETKQLNDGNSNDGNRITEAGKSGENMIGGGGFGVGRGMQDMWMGGPMMMGPRGVGPRGMGMIGVPRGVGVPPPMHRPSPMAPSGLQGAGGNALALKPRTEEDDMKDLEALLNKKSFREMQKSKTGEELLDLIHRPTAKETAVAAKTSVINLTITVNSAGFILVQKQRWISSERILLRINKKIADVNRVPSLLVIRMDILGQFGVIMADPPWDIHMELPYGTMADDEMRTLNVPALQTDGLIFLWVTGRAMELGRECLELWGYKRVEEIIWVKTNQLQRIIRTGRTGHWLNHSKEHCLVGVKGNPEVNRNIDTDVIVAEVRETSRKPDEVPEVFAPIRQFVGNSWTWGQIKLSDRWLSLGNQLQGVRLVDEGLRARFKAAYPDVDVQPSSPPRTAAMEVDRPAPPSRNPFVEAETKSSGPQFTEPTGPAVPYTLDAKAMSVDGDMTS